MAALPARCRASKGAASWIEEYRRFWEESLDRLEDYLREIKEGGEIKNKWFRNEKFEDQIQGVTLWPNSQYSKLGTRIRF